MSAENEKLILVNNISDEIGFKETYGYENALILRRGSKEIHIILGDTVPTGITTYDSAPVGSLFLNSGGGDDTTGYLKDTSAAAGWAAITGTAG